MTDAPTIVLGTAGHIDHGKSRLVDALTGTHPDRLPEEKSRGMTIDLGFAHARIGECDVSFVDVPGHERFIHNMVAGATGVDLALLVVAADDSVMPQTREHAEVLALLGVERCIVTLTKMDLVDDEWADAVEAEVREFLDTLELTSVAVVRTSAETGRGLDELRQAIAGVATDLVRARPPYGWFRMPVDRSFVVTGRGTVVTGSVAHGALERDAEVELWPAGQRVRVRDLQTHNDDRTSSDGRMRLAANLAAVGKDDVQRGDELATPGYLTPSTRLDVWIERVRMPGKHTRQNLRLRLHMGTMDVLAELQLLERPEERNVRRVFAQIQTAEPVVATWHQRFVLRDEAATQTLGGGRILRPRGRRWTRRYPPHLEGLETLREGSPRARLEEVIRNDGWGVVSDALLSSEAGLRDADEAARLVRSLLDKGLVVALESGGQRLLVHRGQLDALSEELAQRLTGWLAANPRTPGIARSEWVNWMPRACPDRHRSALSDWLIREDRVALLDGRVVPVGHAGALGKEDQQLLETILDEFHAGAFQPPGEDALTCRTPRNARRVRELIELAVTRGQLCRVANGIWLHAQRWEELVTTVTEVIRSRGGLKVADLRTLLNSSRKYVVPLAEKLDATGVTRRVGDERVLAK